MRKKIREEARKNREEEILEKVTVIREARNPQREIFKIRRTRKKVEKVGFPVKDKKGNTQVSKSRIDGVVIDHFNGVFRQNPIPNGNVWKEYWNLVDDVFEIINKQTVNPNDYPLPSVEEINKLIRLTDDKKSVLGPMKSDLVKLGGDNIINLIHRLICLCWEKEDIPESWRNEKMVLLYKNKGQLFDLDNYRGIFIRLLCLSILQKWLYQKCSPIVDLCGSELAFGGRTKRSVKEVGTIDSSSNTRLLQLV